MVDDPDIWRAAALLVKRHGKDAALIASQRVDDMFTSGDLEGRTVWYRILEAVEELARTKPVEGERVN